MKKPSENHQNTRSRGEDFEDTSPGNEAQGLNEEGSSNGDSQTQVLPDAQEELLVVKEKYLRLAAEFENYKRRMQREQNESIKFANESILQSLLPVIDNLERAIKCGNNEETNSALMEGVKLTYKSFLETVGKLGVRQISSEGQPFDPSRHQAVAQVESQTVEPNMVVDEFQKGYFLHDRILRPAMVTVSRAPSTPIEQPTPNESGEEEGGIHNG